MIMNPAHFSHSETLNEALIGFSRFCRENGLKVGLSHTHESLEAARNGMANHQDTLRYALKSLYVCTEEDSVVYDKCFDIYWNKRKHEYAHKITSKNRSNITRKSNKSLVMMGFNPNGNQEEKETEDAKNVSGMSKIESLKVTDFSKIADIDSPILEELSEKLLEQLNHRLKRKMQASKNGSVDLRRSIRKNLSNGDVLIELSRRNRKKQRYRLILLLDVSGSMDKYSFFLLKFIWALKSRLKNIEAFVFSTKLVRISDYLKREELDHALFQLSENAHNWSSGTMIGQCLNEFNEKYAKRILNGKSVTIVLSDGLDGGSPELLVQEIRKIRMRTSKLIWLNPLKGMNGYEPTARGMQAAHKEVDEFASAHNLESLMELENILSNV